MTHISTPVTYVHLMTGSSSVLCGRPMRSTANPLGWDLGTVRVSYTGVTCPDCLASRKAVR